MNNIALTSEKVFIEYSITSQQNVSYTYLITFHSSIENQKCGICEPNLLTSRFWLKSWIIRSMNNISVLADYEDTLSDPNFISSNILPICHWVR